MLICNTDGAIWEETEHEPKAVQHLYSCQETVGNFGQAVTGETSSCDSIKSLGYLWNTTIIDSQLFCRFSCDRQSWHGRHLDYVIKGATLRLNRDVHRPTAVMLELTEWMEDNRPSSTIHSVLLNFLAFHSLSWAPQLRFNSTAPQNSIA